jgi:hypothetical protein
MLTDLVKAVDKFVANYGMTGSDKEKMKTDLLDIVQKAIDHGADKDQNKISGILVKGIKAFMGGRD